MISSGIKRGLAATAISAMAVTGLPLLASSASATPLSSQIGASAVTLYTPDTAASIKNDGVNTTVHLLANAGTDAAQVRFEYQTVDTVWHAIATVSRTNGAFATEWTPPVSVYNLTVPVRAMLVNNLGIDGANDTNGVLVTSNVDAIDLSETPGSAVGVFQQPYAGPNNKLLGAASASTSDVAVNPAVTFSAPYGGAANNEDTVGTPANGARTVSGPVDYTGYPFDVATPAVDQAIEEANVTAGGDDAEAVTLYKQTIAGVTATAGSPTVQQGGTTPVTVTVTDQNGKPVVGAQVFQDDDNDGTGNGAAVYTNSQGKAVFAAQGGSPTGTTHTFFVNTTGVATYENGTDFKRTATVTEYVPGAATITPKSADGAAFDDDENAGGDISATVKDQNGNPMTGQIVRYAWTVTPFAATVGYPKTLPEGSATTDGSGVAAIPFPTSEPSGTYVLHTYINQDGTPGQQAGDLGGTDLTVKAGDSNVVWGDGTVAQAPAGTSKVFTGKLKLDDGTGLPGRNLALTWSPTGNAVVSAQAAQPAGTTRTGDTTATSVTGTDGSFGISLSDPAATPPAVNANELGGQLAATTTNTTNIGNAGESAALTVDFLKSAGPDDAADITVSQQALIDLVTTPGRPADLDIQVKNADQTATLSDFPVTVSVDHGFLSDNAETAAALVPDPAPAEGGLYGEWKSDGTSVNLTTDDSGNTGAVVAIEKDAGFDTAQAVTTNVTITAGTVTKTIQVVFNNNNGGATAPLNGGEVKFERSASQTVTVLPKAPTTESVNENVYATDQFGNLVKGISLGLTDNLGNAYMNGQDGSTTVTSQLKNEAPALSLSSDVAGNQAVTGTWTAAPKNTWTDGVPATPAFDAARATSTKTVTGTSETINWYAIDYANSTFTLTHSGADTQPVGTTVTETYTAVDQNGEPLSGFDVTFFRTGPDNLGDGDGNSISTTNAQGQAFYVFQGAKAGTATTTAVLREPDGGLPGTNGDLVPAGEKTDQVSFAGQPTTPANINLQLTGRDNGAKADKLTANAKNNAAGLTAKLYRVVNGKMKLVASAALGSTGNHRFTVADKNGKKFTKYVVKVAQTTATNADSASKRVR